MHMQDLESSLHYTFRMEVPRLEQIQGPALTALKQFVSVLVKVRVTSGVRVKFGSGSNQGSTWG